MTVFILGSEKLHLNGLSSISYVAPFFNRRSSLGSLILFLVKLTNRNLGKYFIKSSGKCLMRFFDKSICVMFANLFDNISLGVIVQLLSVKSIFVRRLCDRHGKLINLRLEQFAEIENRSHIMSHPQSIIGITGITNKLINMYTHAFRFILKVSNMKKNKNK